MDALDWVFTVGLTAVGCIGAAGIVIAVRICVASWPGEPR